MGVKRRVVAVQELEPLLEGKSIVAACVTGSPGESSIWGLCLVLGTGQGVDLSVQDGQMVAHVTDK